MYLIYLCWKSIIEAMSNICTRVIRSRKGCCTNSDPDPVEYGDEENSILNVIVEYMKEGHRNEDK
jgi:hypothetical protein